MPDGSVGRAPNSRHSGSNPGLIRCNFSLSDRIMIISFTNFNLKGKVITVYIVYLFNTVPLLILIVKKSEQENVSQKKKTSSCTAQRRMAIPKRNKGTQTKTKTVIDGNAVNDPVISVRNSKMNMQKFCSVMQIKKTRAGNLKFFTGCVPIFLMCGSEEVLVSKNENNAYAFILISEIGNIMAILTDFLLSGHYLINRFFPSGPLTSCTREFAKAFPESRSTLQVVTLSPYLSSTTDPMNGHHFVMVGHMRDNPVHRNHEENTDLKKVIDEFEMSNKCEDEGSCFDASLARNRCDHLYYCMIMSVIRKIKPQLQTRKTKFQMRIQFVDELKMKQKKKKSGEPQKEEDAFEWEGIDKEECKAGKAENMNDPFKKE